MTKLRQVSEAIAHMEGFYVSQKQAARQHTHWPTVPQRLNNPGDLMFARQRNATQAVLVGLDGKARKYAQWKTVEEGFAACDFQITLFAKRGLTVEQTIQRWAPSDDGNNPASYTSGVCRMLGCSPSDLMADVIAEPT